MKEYQEIKRRSDEQISIGKDIPTISFGLNGCGIAMNDIPAATDNKFRQLTQRLL